MTDSSGAHDVTAVDQYTFDDSEEDAPFDEDFEEYGGVRADSSDMPADNSEDNYEPSISDEDNEDEDVAEQSVEANIVEEEEEVEEKPVSHLSSPQSPQDSLQSPPTIVLRQGWITMRDVYRASIGYQRPDTLVKGTKDWFQHLDYIAEGAIPQPPDGPKAKKSDIMHRCLTCIRYKRVCKGTSIDDGECETCRGWYSGISNTVRKCVWLDPSKNLWTYPDAHKAASDKKKKRKTKERKNQRKSLAVAASKPTIRSGRLASEKVEKRDGSRTVRTLASSDTVPRPSLLNDSTLMIRSPSPHVQVSGPPTNLTELTSEDCHKLVKRAAAVMQERSLVGQNSHENLEYLFKIIAENNILCGPIEGLTLRMAQLKTQLEVLHALRRMRENNEGLTSEDVFRLASTAVPSET